MILDPKVRSDIEQDWAVVKKFCSRSHQQFQIPGGPFLVDTPPESFYNLPFLLAYAVLEQVLETLICQGTIPGNMRAPLGEKMKVSANVIAWQNYGLIECGYTARNNLAHRALLLARVDCFKYIDAIERELKAWAIL